MPDKATHVRTFGHSSFSRQSYNEERPIFQPHERVYELCRASYYRRSQQGSDFQYVSISPSFQRIPNTGDRMRIACLGVRVPGHLNPMTTLARRLKAREHDVVFISVLDTEPYVRAAQLPFIPYCEKEFPLGSVRQKTDQLGKLQGQAALEFAIGNIANSLEAAFRNLPQTLQQARVDGVVLDQVDFESFHWPPQFHYTGPFHDGRGRIESDFPWDRLTGEPLIYASMGTLQNGLESVFSSIAEAVGRRPGMQLVLSIGPTLDPRQV